MHGRHSPHNEIDHILLRSSGWGEGVQGYSLEQTVNGG